MKYLVDSDYVVDYLKGKEAATALLSSLEGDGLAISLITYGEIYEGIYFGTNQHKHEQGFLNFLRLVVVLPISEPVMQQFAHVRGELRRTGKLIGDFDILVAATAMQHNLTLLTRNLKDFQRISDLNIYQP